MLFIKPGLDTSDATATAEDLALDKTAYVDGEKVTGSHVCEAGLDTSDATATPDLVAEGATFYAQGEKKTGSVHVVQTARNEFGDVSETSGRITLTASFDEPALFPAGVKHNVRANLSEFGDATAADVAKGKTFTGADGLKVEGAMTSANLSNVFSGMVTPADATLPITIDTGYTGAGWPKFVLVLENVLQSSKTVDRYSPVVGVLIRNHDNDKFAFSNDFGGAYVGSLYKSSASSATSVTWSGSAVRAANETLKDSNNSNAYNLISFRSTTKNNEITFTTAEVGGTKYGLRPGTEYIWFAVY